MLVHRNNVAYLLDFRTKLETEPMKHWYYMTKSTSQEAGDGYLQNQRELYIYMLHSRPCQPHSLQPRIRELNKDGNVTTKRTNEPVKPHDPFN